MQVDDTPPEITRCPDSQSTTVPLGTTSAFATWIPPTAIDDSGTVPTCSSPFSPGQSFPIGITQVTYVCTDEAGNMARCTFSVSGKYQVVLFHA